MADRLLYLADRLLYFKVNSQIYEQVVMQETEFQYIQPDEE